MPETGRPQLVRTSVYICSVSKEQQKNRGFLRPAAGKTFGPILPIVKAETRRLSGFDSNRAYPFVRTSGEFGTTDLGHSTGLSAWRQPLLNFSLRGILYFLRSRAPEVRFCRLFLTQTSPIRYSQRGPRQAETGSFCPRGVGLAEAA